MSALYDVYVGSARVPPKLGAIRPDWLNNGVVEQVFVVQTQGRTGVYNPVEIERLVQGIVSFTIRQSYWYKIKTFRAADNIQGMP